MRKIPFKILDSGTAGDSEGRSSSLELRLPPKLAGLLRNRPARSWLVGGAIRDWLLKKEPQDFDFLLAAIDYQQLKSRLPGIKKTGGSFPVLLYQGFEINLISDNQELTRELSRRDFTVNSLAVDLKEGRVRDPQGGYFDIKKKYIQAIPGSLRADPCRLYRGCRLLAEHPEFVPTEYTLTSFRTLSQAELREIAGERIQQELARVLSAEKPELFFATLLQADKLAVHFPGLADKYQRGCWRLKQLREFTSRQDLAFAALVLDLELNSQRYLNLWETRMALPGRWLTAARLAGEMLTILRSWRSQPAEKILELHERVERASFSLEDLIFLAVSEDLRVKKSGSSRDFIADYRRLADILDEMEQQVTAADLLKVMEPGPELGKKLRRQRVKWLNSCL